MKQAKEHRQIKLLGIKTLIGKIAKTLFQEIINSSITQLTIIRDKPILDHQRALIFKDLTSKDNIILQMIKIKENLLFHKQIPFKLPMN